MENTGNKKISPSVVRLGWVSLLTDTSSKMRYPLNLLFLLMVIKAPMAAQDFRATFIYGAAAALLAVIMFVFLVKGKK